MEKVKYLLQSFDFRLQASSEEYIMMFDKYVNKNNIDIEDLKNELEESIIKSDIDWVTMAIDAKFVYTSEDTTLRLFDVDELLIFTDSFRWKDIVQYDAVFSLDQKEELKEQFLEIGVQHYKDIYELFDNDEFDWLPFEVKHAYFTSFGALIYTNEDIIYYLKSIVWDYLFPDQIDLERLNALKEESLSMLENEKSNEGWLEMASIVESLSTSYPNLDLYELSQIKWDKTVQLKMDYRNPFAAGFIRKRPLS